MALARRVYNTKDDGDAFEALAELRRGFAAADPEFEERLAANTWRRMLALALRGLRKSAGLDQGGVMARTGMKQAQISRVEQPSGPQPRLDTLASYLHACGYDLLLSAAPHGGGPAKQLIVMAKGDEDRGAFDVAGVGDEAVIAQSR